LKAGIIYTYGTRDDEKRNITGGFVKRQDSNGKGSIRTRRTAAILDAAEIEFSHKGYEGTSIQSIADRARLTKWQVLYFFKTKENLYREVVDRIFSEWRSFNGYLDEGSPSQIVSNYIEHLFRFSQIKPHRSNLIINEMIRGAPVAIPLLHEREADVRMKQTKERFEQWIAENKARPIDPMQFLFLIWSSHHFYAAFESEVAYFMGRKKLSADDWNYIIEQVKTVFLSVFDSDDKAAKA
jgi:TetR/AcrR family transcriptional regulator